MATKQAIEAAEAARRAAEREMRRWDGILTQRDYQASIGAIARRAADAAVRAWRSKMKDQPHDR